MKKIIVTGAQYREMMQEAFSNIKDTDLFAIEYGKIPKSDPAHGLKTAQFINTDQLMKVRRAHV
jgi:hypothetical protein